MKISSVSSSDIRTRASPCTSSNKSQSRSYWVWTTCIVVAASSTPVRSSFFPLILHPHLPPDLKPENVLISFDDVESIIQAELAAEVNATSPPTRLIGVPPSKGRGGNQTPRSESISIIGSQPLPSPSSSFGSSPMLDKIAFGMSKIDGEATSKPGSYGSGSVGKDLSSLSRTSTGLAVSDMFSKRADSTEVAAERISSVSLHSSGFSKMSTPHPSQPPGPSLLTQMAPSQPPVSTSSQPHSASTSKPPVEPSAVDPKLSSSIMSVDSVLAETSTTTSSLLDNATKITVKIADLGNGWYLYPAYLSLYVNDCSLTIRLDGTFLSS